MFPKRAPQVLKDPAWIRLFSFSTILFFVFLGDAILAFWVPNLLQNSLGSSRIMGLVISFSSIAGLLMDLTFPQAAQSITVKRLVTFGTSFGIVFATILLFSLKVPFLIVFLLAMTVWGIYYDFLNYASQQFLSDTMPKAERSGGWAVFSIFKNIAYLVGPLLSAWFLLKGEWVPAAVDIFLLTLGLGLLFIFRRVHERPVTIEVASVNLWAEVGHWRSLVRVVWPIVILSLMLGIIDATFWTTGAVLTENLTRQNFWGSFFIPLYQLPSLFVGIIMAKMSITKGKKHLATILLVASSIFLVLLGFASSIFLTLALVFISSAILAVVYPLVNGVYTDMITRMGRERKHMIGLSDSTLNLAYIIGPILAGFLSSWVGEEKTFSAVGAIVLIICIFLLIFTPKKLRLPEKEIRVWE